METFKLHFWELENITWAETYKGKYRLLYKKAYIFGINILLGIKIIIRMNLPGIYISTRKFQ